MITPRLDQPKQLHLPILARAEQASQVRGPKNLGVPKLASKKAKKGRLGVGGSRSNAGSEGWGLGGSGEDRSIDDGSVGGDAPSIWSDRQTTGIPSWDMLVRRLSQILG